MQIQHSISPNILGNSFNNSMEIDKLKDSMRDMPFFQVFSHDGFHQTLYAKCSKERPKVCIVLPHADLDDIKIVTQIMRSDIINMGLVVTNDIYFNENCDFLKQEQLENIIILLPGDLDSILVGQPSKIDISINIKGQGFYKEMDKFISYLSNFKIDTRYFEMAPTYLELLSVLTMENIVLKFGMYVNVHTSVEFALEEIKNHIKRYLYGRFEYSEQYIHRYQSFYNHDLRSKVYLMSSLERTMQSFVECITDKVWIESRFLIGINVMGLIYTDIAKSTQGILNYIKSLH